MKSAIKGSLLLLPLLISGCLPAAPTPRRGVPDLGEIVTLSSEGIGTPGSPVVLYRDTDALEAVNKAQAADDQWGIRALILADEVFSVPTGTRARVLGAKGWYEELEVRIEDGEEAGRAGLVPVKLVARGG